MEKIYLHINLGPCAQEWWSLQVLQQKQAWAWAADQKCWKWYSFISVTTNWCFLVLMQSFKQVALLIAGLWHIYKQPCSSISTRS